ncbi:helix-turn-helix domain-containing protein [Halococcus sp. IIIV-5B]|uniref:helix-turn-helix domain-containing protein n=1 Tax=Halococcus sp. IIIV-5B TaxID=2321230 RepID=UPI001F451DBD|nr:helix-turn-helix domain-containing protein [Halococcus sp. IIIV-5B]
MRATASRSTCGDCSVISPSGRSASTTLTDAQRDALLAAYESGYFDEPRGISLAELIEAVLVEGEVIGPAPPAENRFLPHSRESSRTGMDPAFRPS